MDPSAVYVNVTVDDFDSILSYAVQKDWETPDPSSPNFTAAGSPWLSGTYHKTNVVGTTSSFNFTGSAIYVYGYAGPAYGSFEVQIDSSSTTLSAFAPENASTPHLLYGTNALPYAKHTLVLRNLGALAGDKGGNTFLFDYLQTTIEVAPSGASVSNVTYQEDSPDLKYTGEWHTNTSPNFSGGGTSYTNEDKASITLSFHGSTIYMFGDKKNDHGLYSVQLDDNPVEIYNGISGCGGAFGPTCEQQKPTLQYLASNLNSSLHTIKIQNIAVQGSFFDLDSIVTTVPSVYNDSRTVSSTTSTPSTGATSSKTHSNSASLVMTFDISTMMNPLVIFIIGVLLLLRPRFL